MLVTVLGVLAGVVLAAVLLLVSVVTVRRRNIQLPGLPDSVRSVLTPGYTRMEDVGMVGVNYLVIAVTYISFHR